MKRVKVMLTAILVMAVVAAGLAFNVKAVNHCAYSTDDADDRTVCPIVHATTTCVNSITALGGTDEFARTLQCNTPCPATTVCTQSRTLIGGE